jgi:UDP-2,4-diacetamido-2,4,6-trideoxy-beta-L-altropyranose hydrolase
MRFAFRVDASQQIGTGHVMRCLTLATALRDQGHIGVFICRDHEGHLAEMIRQKGYACHLLSAPTAKLAVQENDLAHADWLGVSWQEDAQQTANILTETVDWLVVDHYAIDARWESALSGKYRQLMVIDDLADRAHIADVLLDQTLGRQAIAYQPFVPTSCRLLLGAKYALLRPEFAQHRVASLAQRASRHQVKSVLINMGGVDADNMTAQVLMALNRVSLPKEIRLQVVMGGNAPHLSQVEQLAAAMHYQTQILVNASNMATLMVDADVAIGAAGSTTWERACLGLPSLLFCLAENQRVGVEAIAEAGAAWYVRSIADMLCSVQILLNMPERLRQMQQLAYAVTDGQGVEKIVNKLVNTSLVLRRVSIDDAALLFSWRNHPSIRAVSHQQAPLVYQDHETWLAQSLNNPNRLLWIAMQDQQPIGVIRFDRDSSEMTKVEVSLYLAPEMQGKGLGQALLFAGEQQLHQTWRNVCFINADVLPSNAASLTLFERAGYTALPNRFCKQVSLC